MQKTLGPGQAGERRKLNLSATRHAMPILREFLSGFVPVAEAAFFLETVGTIVVLF